MKPLFLFLLVLTLAIFLGTTTSTPRGLNFDGFIGAQSGAVAGTNLTFWETDESLSGADGVKWYLTWETNNFYLGREGGSNTDTTYIFIRAEGTGNQYTNTLPSVSNFLPTFADLGGINYLAKMHSGLTNGGLMYWFHGPGHSSAWGPLSTFNPASYNEAKFQTYAFPTPTANMEAKLGWYTVSNTTPLKLKIVFYQTNGSNSYGQSPNTIPTGLTPAVNWWWDFQSVTSGIGPNVNPPLPVQLVSFVAVASRLQVELQWSTATEVNNYGFEVQRRIAGDPADEWRRVALVRGAGTSTSERHYALADQGLQPGRYAYRLMQIDNDGTFEYSFATEIEVGLVAKDLMLSGNYPNPFNPSTRLEFSVPEDGKALLRIYDINGKVVATPFDGNAQAGRLYQVTFDASRLPTGVYFSRLEFGTQQRAQKIVFAK